MNVRESQIEDVLAAYPTICKGILNTVEDLSLVARQKILSSGDRIDLLFLSGNRIILVELKAVAFHRHFLLQALDYVGELKALQQNKRLIDGEITPYLLCTSMSDTGKKQCEAAGVVGVQYSIEYVFECFFATLRDTKSFITVRPRNHGLWNLHLLNRILYELDEPKLVTKLEKALRLSRSSTLSYLNMAAELLLVRSESQSWMLTDAGKQYVWSRDPSGTMDVISEDQSAVLQQVIIDNPFASGAIFGIYSLVESVYNLSRSTYPVDIEDLTQYFRESCGRHFEWKAIKTAHDATRMYSNYAIDIGLIGRVGKKFYLTPSGIKFILLLNLHKAMQMVDALGIHRPLLTTS